MIADPQSVTIDGVAAVLNRTSSGVNNGEFTTADRTAKLAVSHQYGKRVRRLVRLDWNEIGQDPLTPAQNVKVGMAAYLVIDVPDTGISLDRQKDVVDGFLAKLTADGGALLLEILGGEN